MKPHPQMKLLIAGAAELLLPALGDRLVDGNGLVDGDALQGATLPIDQLLRSRSGPVSGVYISWDIRGTCRYVGSAYRPSARSAVRDRLREHMGVEDRRARWYAVTVLPIQPRFGLGVLRQCEGMVARRLSPVEGSAHPIPSIERSLNDLLAVAPAPML